MGRHTTRESGEEGERENMREGIYFARTRQERERAFSLCLSRVYIAQSKLPDGIVLYLLLRRSGPPLYT